MRHRLFHAIVIVGAASACSEESVMTNPPPPDAEVDTGVVGQDSAVDTGVAKDSAVADSTASDSAVAETTADAPVDTCVDEGCGCFPCIK